MNFKLEALIGIMGAPISSSDTNVFSLVSSPAALCTFTLVTILSSQGVLDKKNVTETTVDLLWEEILINSLQWLAREKHESIAHVQVN